MTLNPLPPQASWYQRSGHHHDAMFDNRDPVNEAALTEFERVHPTFLERVARRLRRCH